MLARDSRRPPPFTAAYRSAIEVDEKITEVTCLFKQERGENRRTAEKNASKETSEEDPEHLEGLSSSGVFSGSGARSINLYDF